MGYMRHHAILITGPTDGYANVDSNTPTAERLHARLCELCPGLVSDPVPARINGYSSIAVFPDGSKEGWDESDLGDAQRQAAIDYLRTLAYDDGSTAWEWVLVQYGDDDHQSLVIDHSDKAPVPAWDGS